MRDFVRGHPDYQHDSKITDSIQYDLLQEVKKLFPKKLMMRCRVYKSLNTISKDILFQFHGNIFWYQLLYTLFYQKYCLFRNIEVK